MKYRQHGREKKLAFGAYPAIGLKEARLMRDEARVEIGRGGDPARCKREEGGERACLALSLITRDDPHLLVLDEPTSHLDVDAREALVQAINEFGGAVLLISHDRNMVELVADRLVLVDNGTATKYAGSMEDDIDFVLGWNQPKSAAAGRPVNPPPLTSLIADTTLSPT